MKTKLIFILYLMIVVHKSWAQNKIIDSLLAVLKTAKQDTNRVNTLNNLSKQFYLVGNYNESKIRVEAGMALAQKLNFKKGIAHSYNNKGLYYYFTGDYPEALKQHAAALKIRESILDKKGISASHNNIGMVYGRLGNYPGALKEYFTALKIKEEIGDKNGIAESYNNMGNIYLRQANYSEALKVYIDALKIREKIGDKDLIATSHNNIGLVYSDQGNYQKALTEYFTALKLMEKIGNKKGISDAHANIGNVYSDQGNYAEALKEHNADFNFRKASGDKNGIAGSLANIGFDYVMQSKPLKGKEELQKALAIAQQIGNIDYIKTIHFRLALADSALYIHATKAGMWQAASNYSSSALKNYKMYVFYYDSLINEENTKKTTQLQMRYEFDKKETAAKTEQGKKDAIAKQELEKQKVIRNLIAGGSGIIALSGIFLFLFYKRKRDAEQKQKETSLSLQVSETEMKALRSQMNPHFIFNALQSIQTFLLSHKSEEANTYLLKFSKLMRLVLENSQHGEVSLKEDLEALELYMQLECIRLPHPFTYQFHVDESVDVDNTVIPPLILQPFVENAIWHGLQYKPEPGHINIYIRKKDNALYATVEDNGVGRDMSKQVTQPMLLKKESLGMKLTEERLKILNELKKIKAEFKITDLFTNENKPAGTKVELSLPLVA